MRRRVQFHNRQRHVYCVRLEILQDEFRKQRVHRMRFQRGQLWRYVSRYLRRRVQFHKRWRLVYCVRLELLQDECRK